MLWEFYHRRFFPMSDTFRTNNNNQVGKRRCAWHELSVTAMFAQNALRVFDNICGAAVQMSKVNNKL